MSEVRPEYRFQTGIFALSLNSAGHGRYMMKIHFLMEPADQKFTFNRCHAFKSLPSARGRAISLADRRHSDLQR